MDTVRVILYLSISFALLFNARESAISPINSENVIILLYQTEITLIGFGIFLIMPRFIMYAFSSVL